MKKILLILGLILVIGLVSCTPIQEPVTENNEVETDGPTPADLPEEEDEPMEEPEEPKTRDSEPATEPENKEVAPTVSKEELDQLKEDLEGMEFEDLGGLSE